MKNIVPESFLQQIWWIQNQIQCNHWKEIESGWQHEVLGIYFKKMTKAIDRLVESVASIFGKENLIGSADAYHIFDDLNHLELIDDIAKIILEFRNLFTSYPGIINIIDDILELGDSTNYKLKLK